MSNRLIIVIFTLALFSCNRKEFISPAITDNTISIREHPLFMKWAEAHNGRWLPYAILKTMAKKGISRDSVLPLLAQRLKIVNNARTYYKNQIQLHWGLPDSILNSRLDSMYKLDYKVINKRLLYKSSMDSLFETYKTLPDFKKESVGNDKTVFRNSASPGSAVFFSSDCISADITDWFENSFDDIYTKLQALHAQYHNQWGGMNNIFGGYVNALNGLYNSGCTAPLLADFFRYSVPGYYEYSDVGAESIQIGPFDCQQATDGLVSSIFNYYSSSSTFTGSNGKHYIAGAETMLEYLKSSYGTQPSNTVILESTSSEPLTESKIKAAINGKNGIYAIIANDPSGSGFGASGHVDLLVGGMFASGHSYYYCTGGVKKVYLFILE